LSVSPGLMLNFRVGGLKAPMTIKKEIGYGSGKRAAGNCDDVPDVSEFGETEKHAIIKAGCDERSDLRATELSEKRTSRFVGRG
jgi:hypothetical protein